MLLIAIDAAVLVFVLQAISNDELDFITAVIVALVASIGMNVLAIGLVSAMGMPGLFLAAIIVTVLMGVAISAFFGVEIKRAFLAGAIFLATHIGVSFLFGAMFS
ncbi:MAG: hypothetical protein JW818_16665 [Pirellulales bacterium]|nr:hypothetical protein [Pirellulales bacterium]